MKNNATTIAVKLDAELLCKLDTMARQTQRTRSQLLRLLLIHAALSNQPEIVFLQNAPSSNAVSASSEQYQAELAVIGTFLDERCERGPQFTVTVGELHAAYVGWCALNSKKPLDKNVFGKRLVMLGISKGRTKLVRFYRGLRLKKDPAPTTQPLICAPHAIPAQTTHQ